VNGMATSYWKRLRAHNRFPDQGKIKISMDELQALVEDAYQAGSKESTGCLTRLRTIGQQVEEMIGGGK